MERRPSFRPEFYPCFAVGVLMLLTIGIVLVVVSISILRGMNPNLAELDVQLFGYSGYKDVLPVIGAGCEAVVIAILVIYRRDFRRRSAELALFIEELWSERKNKGVAQK